MTVLFESILHRILGNPGVTHSVPTAFIMMNAVGTEWVTPGLPTEWVTPGLPRMLTSSAHDLLNLLNELRKSDKMRGLYFLKLDNELSKFNNT